MKMYDKVEVLNDSEDYAKEGVYKGMIGRIESAEIRGDCFSVIFIDPRYHDPNYVFTDESMYELEEDKICTMKIKDLKLVEVYPFSDEDLLDSLPRKDPRWWCKVENGYIINLLGQRRNKIPYDYES